MALKVEDIRNVAFCGHGSVGKTTLVDKILMKTGAVSGQHSVDDGTSICDADEEEQNHKYSIESAVTHFEHAGKFFNAIDTPGYPDFVAQAIGALRGVDTAVVVINAASGIEVNTRRVYQEAVKNEMGRIIVLNRMDEDKVDFPAVLASIQELWGAGCVPLNVPLGQGSDFRGVASTLRVPDDTAGAVVDPGEISEALLESIIEVDEEVTERYFEGKLPTDEEISRLIVQSISEGNLVPILCASAKNDLGIDQLLEMLALCSIPANQVVPQATKEGDEVTVKPDPEAPLCGQVFKTRVDPFVQKVSYIRIYSGTLHKDDHIDVSTARKGVKVGQLYRPQGVEIDAIDSAGPGEIVAVAKLEELHTGATIGELRLPEIKFPTPMVGLAASPKSRGDEAKLSGALHKIAEEDPAFRIDRDAQTKELVITGMSELHLTVLQERLKRRDKVEIDTKEPKIPYRETIQGTAEGSYRHKKQSGGRGQFGEVHIRMQPFPENTDPEEFCTKERFPQMREFHYHEKNNFVWVDSIVGGSIPNNFLPAVEKGFIERMTRGVIAGYQVQDVCVEVFFGKHHPVDSSEAAFKMAGSMGFRNVFQEAKPSILEPMVKIHITVPGEHVGDINSDMSGRRGRVLGMEAAGGGMQTIEGEVPLAEVLTYNRTLSSMTGGQGSYTIEFSHYDPVPGNVQQQIIAQAKLEEEEED